jgi:hypothetical protein
LPRRRLDGFRSVPRAKVAPSTTTIQDLIACPPSTCGRVYSASLLDLQAERLAAEEGEVRARTPSP